LIGSWVPVWVEEYESVGPNEVEPTPTSFTAEKEYELIAIRVVELVHKFLALGDVHCAIETEGTIISVAAELIKHVESLGIIADQDDLVVRILPDTCKHSIEDLHLARIPGSDVPVPTSCFLWDIVIWPVFFTSWQVVRKVEQIWMVAELFQQANCLKRLTSFAPKEGLDVRAFDKVVV
jgi:hypothetical protein